MTKDKNDLMNLRVNKPGPGISILSMFLSGVKEVSSQIEPYTNWWNAQNKQTFDSQKENLLVVMGDSAALSVGASSPQNGYVNIVRESLEKQTMQSWGVINFAMSGAKVSNALEEYLPALESLPDPDSLICCIGSNDIFWSISVSEFHDELREMISLLPKNSVIGTLAGLSPRSAVANTIIKKASKKRDLHVLNPWGKPGSGLNKVAGDKFHPNDKGHELIAEAFLEILLQD